MKALTEMTSAQLEALHHQLEIDVCSTDAQRWVEHFVYIEDRDSPTLAVKFHLWDGQKKALNEFQGFKLNVVLKARQLGLSWLALAYAAWLMWKKPGVSIIVMSRGETESKEMARRVGFIMRHLPSWMMTEGSKPEGNIPCWDMTTSIVTVLRKGGEPSTLQSMPAGQNSGRSFTANLIILDEWAFQSWAEEIWASIFPSVNRPTGGAVIGISTMNRGSLFEKLWMDSVDGKNDFNRIFLGWNTDPRRTAEWYVKTKNALGDAVMAEYPATEEEAFLIPGGAMFPEMRADIHLVKPEPIPQWHQRIRFLDYGMDMLACYWVAIDGHGKARIYRELYQSNLTMSEACKAILQANAGDNISVTYAPPDLWWRRQDTGLPAATTFAKNGVPLYQATNSHEGGWMAVHEWLLPRETRNESTGEIVFKSDLVIEEGAAPNLWRCMLSIQKDKHNPNDAADSPHELTHAPSAIRYFCAARTVPTEHVEDAQKSSFWDEPVEESVTGGQITNDYMGGW